MRLTWLATAVLALALVTLADVRAADSTVDGASSLSVETTESSSSRSPRRLAQTLMALGLLGALTMGGGRRTKPAPRRRPTVPEAASASSMSW